MFYFGRRPLHYFQLMPIGAIPFSSGGTEERCCPKPCEDEHEALLASIKPNILLPRERHRLDMIIQHSDDRIEISKKLVRQITIGSRDKRDIQAVKLRQLQALTEYLWRIKEYYQRDCSDSWEEVKKVFDFDCVREMFLCEYGLHLLVDEMVDNTGVKELCFICEDAIYYVDGEPVLDNEGKCIQF